MDESAAEVTGLADPGTFEPEDLDLRSRDPLDYPGYVDALTRAAERAATDESVVAGPALIEGHDVELAVFNFSFMGGSMGEVAGERLARSMERAAARRVPFVLRTATGGARMQEGMRSLIQMPKVVAARLALADSHQPFIAVLGHPTTGGVYASVASLADFTIAEEEATIGFAGPRVAERVTGEPLPPGSHTASFAYDNGMVDDLVGRDKVRLWVGEALKCLAPDEPADTPEEPAAADVTTVPDAWDTVTAVRARDDMGPSDPALVLVYPGMDDRASMPGSLSLEGDRTGEQAPSLSSHMCRVDGRRFLLLQPSEPLGPGEFRKALRCIDIAVRLHLPIVTLIDTPGADPSAGSEEQGIARLIATLTEKMLSAPVPILSVVTGEGGSGGALAFATADVLVAYETSYFSVIGPEAAAEILWKDASRAPEAARALKLTAHHLLELGIADHVVAGSPSPSSVKQIVTYHLDRLAGASPRADLPARRRSRWRNTW